MEARLQDKRVVIVGGGPAGATVALSLARRGLTPLVLESAETPASKIGECLPPNANPLLEQLGLKERLARDGQHLPSHGNRSFWGSSAPIERDFLFGMNGHGWHLDRRRFEETLEEAAREAGVRWQSGCRLTKLSRRDGTWELNLREASGDRTLAADFVVDATGRRALVARRAGARRVRYDRLIGATVLLEARAGEGLKDSFTQVEAVPAGWWYSARLPGDKLVVAYMTDSDLVDHARLRRMDYWLSLLGRAFETHARVLKGGYRPLTPPRILAAHNARLTSTHGEGWLAVGDAATAHDPLASHGISSAMGAGFYAGSAIADYLGGESGALKGYSEIISRVYEQFLFLYEEHYRVEGRWPGEVFWRRRHRRRVLP